MGRRVPSSTMRTHWKTKPGRSELDGEPKARGIGFCDVVCDVTADTDSQISRCTPRCADVAPRTVNIGDDQYLCATAATCCVNSLITAIQTQSIRDQEVPSSNLGAPTIFLKDLASGSHFKKVQTGTSYLRHRVSTTLDDASRLAEETA
jgi:hypothetical protein